MSNDSQHWTPGHSLGGIHEFSLPNGQRLLVLPDRSKPSITVNNTVLVGSRLERAGERGMAHLLEHMLFKGTPSFPDIPRALRERGARFNGTTWLDRTHYYETLPSSGDNLAFAIQLEAERMSATRIDDQVFETEVDVVKNELLRGENSPSRVLFQRVQSICYGCHGYGHPTIGYLSELESMTADQLRAFYRRHYSPHRAVLVVAGDVDIEQVKQLVVRYFGELRASSDDSPVLSAIKEPARDGERSFALHRVTNVNEWVAAYHIPSGGHKDFPLFQMLVHLLTLRPSGRVYQNLVATGLASKISCTALSLYDPGLLLVAVDVPDSDKLEAAKRELLRTVEQDLLNEITPADFERARNELLKRRTLEMADSSRMAIALTESIALGDWRYYFLQGQRIAEARIDELDRVVADYLHANNRTLGCLHAGEQDAKCEIPNRGTADLSESVQSKIEAPSQGQPFDPSPSHLESALIRTAVAPRTRLAVLNRHTRGDLVTFLAHFRLGNESRLAGAASTNAVLAEWLPRGTTELDHLAVQDQLRALQGWIQFEGFRGGISVEGQVPKRNVAPCVELMRNMLAAPRLEEEEFEVLQSAALTSIDQRRTQPSSLASNRLKRALAVYPQSDVRHVRSLDDQYQAMEKLTPASCVSHYRKLVGGQYGEIVWIGPGLDEIESHFDWIESWKSKVAVERIEETAQMHDGEHLEIHLADKSNVGLSAGMNLQIRDDDPDYPALVLANYVFGGATLVSRLSTEVRGNRGLSYSIFSSIFAHPIDNRGRFGITAATNPENRQELLETTQTELQKWVEEGLTEKEVEQGKASLLSSRQVARANDRNLTSLIATQEFANRTLEFVAAIDDRLGSLSADEVNEAVRRWIDVDRMVYVVAGDLEG